MKDWKAILRRIGPPRLVLGGVLLVTLAVPATREVHVLTVRLLFRLRGEKTYVQGQPPGCIVHVVPNVQFTDDYRRKCAAASSDSPDAFILAAFCTREPVEPPPPASWKGHPLLEWSALELGSKFAFSARLARALHRPRPHALPTDPVVTKSLELIRCAQRTNPENGALWLAEANVLFYVGRDDAAMDALKTAAAKPLWDGHGRTAYRHALELLASEGLPRFDALTEVAMVGRPGSHMTSWIETELTRLMTKAVADGDDDGFVSIVQLLRGLQKPAWQDGRMSNGFGPRYPYYSSDMIRAMAGKLGRKLTGPDGAPLTLSWRLGRELFEEFLASCVGAEPAAEIMGEEARKAARLDAERWREPKDKEPFPYDILSGIPGSTSVLALALFLAGLVLELPFILLKEEADSAKKLPRSARFWAALAGAFLVALCVLMSFAMAFSRRVGLRSGPPPALSEFSENLFFWTFACACWFAARVFSRRRRGWFTAILAASFCLYLVAVVGTGYLRHRAVEMTMEVELTAASQSAPPRPTLPSSPRIRPSRRPCARRGRGTGGRPSRPLWPARNPCPT